MSNETVHKGIVEKDKPQEEGCVDKEVAKSWMHLFPTKSLASQGMFLSYISPEIVNGLPVAKLKKLEVHRLARHWIHVVVLFVCGNDVIRLKLV